MLKVEGPLGRGSLNNPGLKPGISASVTAAGGVESIAADETGAAGGKVLPTKGEPGGSVSQDASKKIRAALSEQKKWGIGFMSAVFYGGYQIKFFSDAVLSNQYMAGMYSH